MLLSPFGSPPGEPAQETFSRISSACGLPPLQEVPVVSLPKEEQPDTSSSLNVNSFYEGHAKELRMSGTSNADGMAETKGEIQ